MSSLRTSCCASFSRVLGTISCLVKQIWKLPGAMASFRREYPLAYSYLATARFRCMHQAPMSFKKYGSNRVASPPQMTIPWFSLPTNHTRCGACAPRGSGPAHGCKSNMQGA